MSILPIAKLILTSLFRKVATVSYPLKPLKRHDLVRGHVGVEIEKCIFCGICQRKCPTVAIIVDKPAKTWQISRFQCILCNNCIESCPKKCLTMYNTLTAPSDHFTKDTVKDARISADT